MKHGTTTRLVFYLDTLPEPRVVMRRDCMIIGANRAYLEHYGLEKSDVIGRRCYEVSHRSNRPCYEKGESCPLYESLKSGRPSRVVHVHHTPLGEEHVDVMMTPILNEHGDVECLVEMINVLYSAKDWPLGDLVGSSPAFRQMMKMVERVARSDAAVLLLGESGTGKELVARAVHHASQRAKGPLVAVDCSSLPENLIESELFGYEKGAFSGATSRKPGLVEAANGGTLFLDEVGDIPLGLQVKLLRLLETGSYRRVGGLELLHSDFRLVAATHRNFDQMVEAGKFRQDLYYRISTFPITLPPLRERIEDLPLLIETLLRRISPDRALSVHPSTLLCLNGYDFPGNIRELRNMLERASLLADGNVLLPEHFPQLCLDDEQDEPPLFSNAGGIMTLDEIERHYIEWQVQNSGLPRDELARRLGVSRRTLFRKRSKVQ